MKSLRKVSLISIALCSLSLSGCMGFRGFIPGKDVHVKNFRHEVTLPWGHSVLTADSVDTEVRTDTAPAVPSK